MSILKLNIIFRKNELNCSDSFLYDRGNRKLNLNEKGGVLVELAIMLPLLVTGILLGVIETGNIIHSHQYLTNIANNAARAASDNFDMQSSVDVEQISANCTAGQRDNTSSHSEIHNKVCNLLFLQGFRPKESSVRTNLTKCASPPSCLDSIEVNISSDFRGLLGVKLFPISVSRVAPYLGKSE